MYSCAGAKPLKRTHRLFPVHSIVLLALDLMISLVYTLLKSADETKSVVFGCRALMRGASAYCIQALGYAKKSKIIDTMVFIP
jgi:hypothetical protein